MELILHGDVAGSDVGNHLGDEERVVFWALLFAVNSIIACLFLKSVQAAYAGSDDYAGTVAVKVLGVKKF